MMMTPKGSWPLALVLLLVGCAPIPKQTYNAAQADHVKTVALAHMPDQKEYEAAVLHHAGASFGLIGALIAVADIHAKSKQLTEAIDPAQTRLQSLFGERLTQALQEHGYVVRQLPIPVGTNADDVVDLAAKGEPVDAVLYLNTGGSYVAAGHASDYVPRVVAFARLSEVPSRKMLYQDVHSYGYEGLAKDSIHAPSDPKYRFANMGALTADPALTRAGLLSGVDLLARRIADDLKRP
jgi:hypothetical protein